MYRKNVASQFLTFQGVDATTGGIKSGVTWTVRRCIDGTFAAGGGTVTEDGTTGFYKYAMSQSDTNGNDIGFNFTGTGAVPQTVNIVTTAADPTDAVRLGLSALPNAAAEAAGGLYTRGTGAGQINQPANGQIDTNAVKIGGTTQTGRDIGASVLLAADQAVNTTKFGGTTVTGRDIGASVLLSSGAGAGQLDFTAGVVKANLSQILGTALTETAGQIAAAFKKFFDKATPTGTINSLPDAVPGAAGGLLVDDVWTDARAAKLDNLDAAISTRSSHSVADIWNALTSGMTTAGSIAKRIIDFLTGDAYVRLGAPVGASISADIAAAKSDTGAIKTKTDQLVFTVANQIDANVIDWKGTTAPAMTGDAFARLGAPAGASVSADIAAVKSDSAAIKAKADNLPAAPAAVGDVPTVAQIAEGMFLTDSGQTYADAISGSVVKEVADNADGTPLTSSQIISAVRSGLFGKGGNIVFLEPGGAATGGTHLYDRVTGAPVWDTTIKPSGPYSHSSLKLVPDSNIGRKSISVDPGRLSFYWRTDALPSGTPEPIATLDNGLGSALGTLAITSAGVLQWQAAGAGTTDGTRSLSVNTFYRITISWLMAVGADDLDVAIYVDGVNELTLFNQFTNGQTSLTSFLLFGGDSSGSNANRWISHLYIDDLGDLTDPGDVRCVAKFPTAVNEDQFDTTGGTGAVNERPLSETNYRQQAGSSQARQNYGLESAESGDIDISRLLVLGCMGWLWVKKSSAIGAGSPSITVDGIDYSISIPGSTPTGVVKGVTQSVYPSAAAAIGLVTGGTSVDYFLYECGVVIAVVDPVFPTSGLIADAVWDENIVAAHQTDDTAGKKLSQALLLYEGD